MSLKQAAVDTAARKDSRPFFLPNSVGLQDLTPFLDPVSSGGEGDEVGVDGLHAQAAHHSQCDAEEWDALAEGAASQSA